MIHNLDVRQYDEDHQNRLEPKEQSESSTFFEKRLQMPTVTVTVTVTGHVVKSVKC